MTKINDFVVKFANVNGSGSASANLLFAKSLFRMGLGVVAKNIFPSNIQGLPTWYEVRITHPSRRARRDGVDVLVAMNPQSYTQDLADIVPGGYLIYDSSLPHRLPESRVAPISIPELAVESVGKASPQEPGIAALDRPRDAR